MSNYQVRSYTDSNGKTLYGVTMLNGQVWAIEPEWSEKMAQAIAKALNDNPDVEPYDLDIAEVGNE